MAIDPCHSLEEHDSSGSRTSHRLRISQSHPSLRDDSNALVDPLPGYPKQTGPCISFNNSIQLSTVSTGRKRERVAGSNSTIQSGEQPNSGVTRSLVDPVQKISLPRTPEKGPRRRCFSAGALGHAPKSPPCRDRFIPERQFSDASAPPFRISKSPQHLSPEEKLLRRRDRREDPFRSPRSGRVISFPRHADYHQRRHSPHFMPHLINDPALSRHDDLLETSDMFRQVSTGAVWNVGGASVATGSRPLGIPDGIGGFSRSGTTAPMHVAKFFDKTSPPEQSKMHEARLALALDIDQARRMLSFWRLPTQPDFKFSPSSPRYEQCCPLTWKDNAWKRAERAEGKCKSFLCLKSGRIISV
ncbi:hypothetical protein VTN77DRAFT_8971 [Rasamsonia byssochlamydoides]|uniref:uncharacterized protein n=1 Tax=Rasamsonia byssochlamydoides TaxID=89139 RepID=UPI003744AAFE